MQSDMILQCLAWENQQVVADTQNSLKHREIITIMITIIITTITTITTTTIIVIIIIMVSLYQWNWIDLKLQENHKEEIVSNAEILDIMQGTVEVNRDQILLI